MDRSFLVEIVWGLGLGVGVVTLGLSLAWSLG
jgi:hypothetical protein